MSKKNLVLSFGMSLILGSYAVVPCAFPADVETVGDLSVQGIIESTSGGFKFPDGSTLTTAGLSGLLFNIGFVVDNSNSNTGDLNSGAIKFGTGATGEGIASQRTAGAGQNGLDFYTNSTSRLFIDNNGKVGIGTRTPAAKLHVMSSDMIQTQFGSIPLYYENTGGNSILGFNLYWDGSKYVYGSSNAGATLLSYSGGLLVGVAASGTAGGSPAGNFPRFVMRMTSEGKVRIGDNTIPAEALDVAGNIKASGNLAATNITAAGALGGANGNIAGSLNIDQGNTNNGELNGSVLTFGLSSGEGIASKRTAGGNRYGLDFYSNFTKRVSISQAGNVGIGTDAPSAKLEVAGDVKANGKVTLGAGAALTAAGGREGLTILRGFIAWNGSCMSGCNGFTVSHTSTGTYKITPDSGIFSSSELPSYIVTPGASQHIATAALLPGYAQVNINRLSDSALADQPFSIVIIGSQQ